MSTKIYGGFKVEGLTWHELMCKLKEFRSGEDDRREKDAIKAIARKAISAMDKHFAIHGAKPDRSLYSAISVAYKEVQKEFESNEMRIVFYPLFDEIYGVMFMDNEAEAKWLAQDFVKEFSYWNNTDRPDHLTDQDWNNRRDIWDAIMGDSSTFATAGLTAECLTYNAPVYRITREMVMEAMPSRESRAKSAAIDFICHKRNVMSSIDLAEFISLISDRNPQYVAEITRLEKELPDPEDYCIDEKKQ